MHGRKFMPAVCGPVQDRLHRLHRRQVRVHGALSAEVPGGYAHHGVKETEAESVTYVMAEVLGLGTAAHLIGYVTGERRRRP